MSKLKPMFARVLLERLRPEKIGSLLVPKIYQTRNAPLLGRVLAKGDTADLSVKVGSWYTFGQHAGVWVNPDGVPVAREEDQHYFVCQDEDLICEVLRERNDTGKADAGGGREADDDKGTERKPGRKAAVR